MKALQSDFVRLAILETYGGIWMDATVHLYHNLDSYVDKAGYGWTLQAFHNPLNTYNMKRPTIETSMLVSIPAGHPLITMWLDGMCRLPALRKREITEYMSSNNMKLGGPFLKRDYHIAYHVLHSVLLTHPLHSFKGIYLSNCISERYFMELGPFHYRLRPMSIAHDIPRVGVRKLSNPERKHLEKNWSLSVEHLLSQEGYSSILPLLPILTSLNHSTYPAWHAYYKRVYGASVEDDVDLNTFTWFYSFAPIRIIPTCVAPRSLRRLLVDTAFVFRDRRMPFDPRRNIRPECIIGRHGFFVTRNQPTVLHKRLIEVMRTNAGEGATELFERWFYHLRGTGWWLSSSVVRKTYAHTNHLVEVVSECNEEHEPELFTGPDGKQRPTRYTYRNGILKLRHHKKNNAS